MGWTAPPASPQCPACKTSVFPAESFMAADRKPFHKKCVKCKTCSKVLTSATLNEHLTQLYCKACYDNIFMPQKPGGDEYGGIVTPEDLKRKEEEERKRLEKAKRAKSERRLLSDLCRGLNPSIGCVLPQGMLEMRGVWQRTGC
eukprot:TRINITY_DN1648_c0_g1_i2.p1 TRINITY_DN1648_c0_g1~~TRINITY_DN1648_c0_g1_i2.p1  ORF type:complete len:144 (-),score=31.88 TRINITY_DN1648_c0_g1_i2:173-604(-)